MVITVCKNFKISIKKSLTVLKIGLTALTKLRLWTLPLFFENFRFINGTLPSPIESKIITYLIKIILNYSIYTVNINLGNEIRDYYEKNKTHKS